MNSSNPPNNSKTMQSLLGGTSSDVHTMPATARPMSAHTAKHAHSKGVSATFGSTPVSEPVRETATGIKTFAAAQSTSEASPFYRPLSRTHALSPAAPRVQSRVRRSIGGSYDDSSVGTSAAVPPPVPKYKRNHALNSSQVFTAIAPDYDPRQNSSTPVTARMTLHLDKEGDVAATALNGARDTPAPQQHKSQSIGGSLRRSKEEAQRLYSVMKEESYNPEGGIRSDKLGPGRGKKHGMSSGPGQSSTDYNIVAPPSEPLSRPATATGTLRASVRGMTGTDTEIATVSVPDALHTTLRSKNLVVPGVTGSITTNNFAKLCMGAEDPSDIPANTSTTTRVPPGYRDASTFTANFMALAPLPATAPKTGTPSKSVNGAKSAELITRAPFGNDKNAVLEVSKHKTLAPRPTRNPVTGALVTTKAVTETSAPSSSSSSSNEAKESDKPKAPERVRDVNSVWGFDSTIQELPKPPARKNAYPYAITATTPETYTTSTLHGRVTPVTATPVQANATTTATTTTPAPASTASTTTAPAVKPTPSTVPTPIVTTGTVSTAPSTVKVTTPRAAPTPSVSSSSSSSSTTTAAPAATSNASTSSSSSSSSSSSASSNSFASAFAAASAKPVPASELAPLYAPVSSWKVDI